MKILVTGGNGMLGTSLKELVHKIKDNSKEYIFLSRENGNLINECDVENIFNEHRPDTVIHLASQVGGVYDNMNNNYQYLMNNVTMHSNIINCCKKYNVKKLINILSTCIFPDTGIHYPLTSEQLHNGLPHFSNIGYAYSKRFLQVASNILSKCNGIKVINIIPTNLYGENDNYHLQASHVIPALIHKTYLAKKNNTQLYIKGTGNAYRQFLYTPDLANVIIKFVELNPKEQEITCIASPNQKYEIQIKDIIQKIVKILDFNGEIIYDPSFSDGQIRKTTNDSELYKYIENINFTDIDSGLKNTITYFIKNYDNIRK